ncbi:mannose 6-phosphate receptor domain-containing protein [Aulographum hederae CBS 113979]|uniref:Mannose 6-phosphate receptor domain-containing protein n=1 Tax=Aulographum hederae CBS 113979 TaxID=1176131 RepID=A0A6G1GW51_9PEZI|nr:mannose 6-phosphate receptor domain-containing protein [Aulographum hederae CBS 113979]
MRLALVAPFAPLLSLVLAASSDKTPPPPPDPCTIKNSKGAFFNLNPIRKTLPDPTSSKHKDDKVESYTARGYDYPANFTINFCGAVVEDAKDFVGVDESLWRNVSAYYTTRSGSNYSIGQQNSELVFRGRKLVLNYTHGSPCPSPSSRATNLLPETLPDLSTRSDKHSHGAEDLDSDDEDHRNDDDDEDSPRKGGSGEKEVRRKSTIISFLCESEPLAPKAAISFVAASEDECTYFFEARSLAACPGVNHAKEQLSPGGVFGVIVLITILVYLVGGCVYQRSVMHQRGWRQLPNYSFWASIGTFVKDIAIILTSSCTRFFPSSSRHSYSRVSSSANGYAGRGGGGRGRDRDPEGIDENRLIDQLDEEWDD